MYKIFADDTLIYDSTFEDYRIGKGQISLEINKSGSFVFSLYPDHFYYDQFVRLKTVITVYKSDRIVFRGRVLNDTTDHYNNKVLTCEGELGFLRDSIVRPFEFNGTIAEFFTKWIENHNAQVDEFKRFKVGKITTTDSNDRIYRNSEQYEKTLDSLNSRTVNSDLGGLFLITHGENGTDEIPTIHYLSDSEKIATQSIEFGVNLKNYTKTVSADEVFTAVIPVSEIDSDTGGSAKELLTIEAINNGKDYVYSETGVALYGWIFKMIKYEDVTNTQTLVKNAYRDLEKSILQNVTVELNAIDMHLLDRSIESFNLCDYIQVLSTPHKFNETLICSKQTLDLLKPSNDKVTLGFAYSAFTVAVNKNTISNINSTISSITHKVEKHESSIIQQTDQIKQMVTAEYVDGEIKKLGSEITQTAKDWTAEFNKIGLAGSQTGITKVDEKGVEVTHSDIGGKTSMNADGFRLYNKDGNVIGGLLNINNALFSAVQRLANLADTTFYVAVSPNIYGDGEHGIEFMIDNVNCGAITAQYLDDDLIGMHVRSNSRLRLSDEDTTVDLSNVYAVGRRVHFEINEPMGEDGDIWLCPVDPFDVS